MDLPLRTYNGDHLNVGVIGVRYPDKVLAMELAGLAAVFCDLRCGMNKSRERHAEGGGSSRVDGIEPCRYRLSYLLGRLACRVDREGLGIGYRSTAGIVDLV